MSPRASQSSIATELASIISRIPTGHVLAIGALSQHFRASPRAIETALKALTPKVRALLPWHRVVMDGGALGQLGPRAEHLMLLRADGLAVAPAGIVQDMARVAIRTVAELPAKLAAMTEPTAAATATTPSGRPSRSRGRYGAPKSSI